MACHIAVFGVFEGEPYPRLERLEIFVGLHARLTMTFLLHNLAIDVKTFVIRPDMALPSGYLCHVMDRLDLFDERQSAIYRLLHKHCPTFSLPEGQSRAPSLPALFRGQAGSDRQYTGHIERKKYLTLLSSIRSIDQHCTRLMWMEAAVHTL